MLSIYITLQTWQVSICIPSNADQSTYSFTTKTCNTLLIPTLPSKTAISSDAMYSTHKQHFRSDTCPKTCIDILKKHKAPTTYLHVTTFLDATCIGFTVPHIMYDALATCDILTEWCEIMKGASTARTLIQGDPFREIANMPFPKSNKAIKQMYNKYYGSFRLYNRKEFYSFISKFIFDVIKHPKEKTRVVFIPMRYIEKIRALAKEKGQWISDNDVVTSALFKVSSTIS